MQQIPRRSDASVRLTRRLPLALVVTKRPGFFGELSGEVIVRGGNRGSSRHKTADNDDEEDHEVSTLMITNYWALVPRTPNGNPLHDRKQIVGKNMRARELELPIYRLNLSTDQTSDEPAPGRFSV